MPGDERLSSALLAVTFFLLTPIPAVPLPLAGLPALFSVGLALRFLPEDLAVDFSEARTEVAFFGVGLLRNFFAGMVFSSLSVACAVKSRRSGPAVLSANGPAGFLERPNAIMSLFHLRELPLNKRHDIRRQI